MQDAVADVEVTTSDPKHVFMLGALVMYPNLISPQHHQGEFARCVVHPAPPTHVSPVAMSTTVVKAGLHECRDREPDGFHEPRWMLAIAW